MKPKIILNREYFDALITSINCIYCPIFEGCPAHHFEGAQTIVYINNLCRNHWYNFVHVIPEPESDLHNYISPPKIFHSQKTLEDKNLFKIPTKLGRKRK